MPILEIEIVLRPVEILAEDLAVRLANTTAEILRSRPRGTWVKLKTLDPGSFAENEDGRNEPVYPVFVTVVKSNFEAGTLATEAEQLAEAVASICDRPIENVHILFEPAAQGRIAFGGKLR